MSWIVDIYLEDFVNKSCAKAMKDQFERYCEWCWFHGFGNCKVCKHRFNMEYLPLKIEEKKKELGLI